jgi:hypothetical protein
MVAEPRVVETGGQASWEGRAYSRLPLPGEGSRMARIRDAC